MAGIEAKIYYLPQQQSEQSSLSMRPNMDGALALSGPPNEPPSLPKKQRHLSLVKPLIAEEQRESALPLDSFVGNSVSYDLDRRRRLRQKRIVPDVLPIRYSSPRPQASEKPIEVYAAPPQKEHAQREPYSEWRKTLTPITPLGEYIEFLDTHWREEGLPADWENLRTLNGDQVGFSLDSQIKLLSGPEKKQDKAAQTERDLLGYILEYLDQKKLVFPTLYEKRTRADGSSTFVDPKYADKEMLQTISPQERNGSVLEAMQRMESFFLSGEGIAGWGSPRGDSGLTTDNGKPIIYKDNLWFFQQKRGDALDGITIKTDFSLAESREAIKRLTGKVLPPDAQLEEYAKAVAFFRPDSHIKSIPDVINVLQSVRLDMGFGSKFAFKDVPWEDVYSDYERRSELYNYNDTIKNILSTFTEYYLANDVSEVELKKALTATILRFAKEFLFSKSQPRKNASFADTNNVGHDSLDAAPPLFGKVMQEAAKLEGCAGGGITSYLNASGERVAYVRGVGGGGAVSSGACAEIRCGKNGCGWKASESQAQEVEKGSLTSCPDCGWKPGDPTQAEQQPDAEVSPDTKQ